MSQTDNIQNETSEEKVQNGHEEQKAQNEKLLTEQELEFCELYVNGGLGSPDAPRNAMWRYMVRKPPNTPMPPPTI